MGEGGREGEDRSRSLARPSSVGRARMIKYSGKLSSLPLLHSPLGTSDVQDSQGEST